VPPPAPAPAPAPDPAPAIDDVLALAHSGDRAAAGEQAERLVRARPLDAETHLLLGLLDLDTGDAARAVESLRRAAFLDANSVLASFSLGRAYIQLGDRSRARGAFVHARRLLGALADDDLVPHGDGLSAGDLRHATEIQIAALDRPVES
jgi:chemotaxis protein methyltransferase CheR